MPRVRWSMVRPLYSGSGLPLSKRHSGQIGGDLIAADDVQFGAGGAKVFADVGQVGQHHRQAVARGQQGLIRDFLGGLDGDAAIIDYLAKKILLRRINLGDGIVLARCLEQPRALVAAANASARKNRSISPFTRKRRGRLESPALCR